MNLFEHFNTTNQTQPWFAKHENFVIDLKSPGCAIVQSKDYEDRCTFVKENDECKDNVQIFDYTYFFYCLIDARNEVQQAFGVFLLFLFCFFLFTFVGTCTDRFFCPPLKIITKSFGISENLAGVTLLAFGNSLPDLFSSLTGISGEVGTAYSDLMGSAMFITGFISGTIVYLKPLHFEPTHFTRDICFHILAITYIDYAIKSDRYVTLTESIVIIAIYIFYFAIVILDHIILIRTLNNLTNTLKHQVNVSEDESNRLKKLQEEAGIEITIKPRLGVSIDISKRTEYSTHKRNEKLFLQLYTSLMPFDCNSWRNGGYVDKFFIILGVPINLLLFTLVPAADFNLELNGWSKLLNCLQIVITPATVAFFTASNYTAFGFPLPIFTLFITVPICVITFLITRTDTPPSFHIMFALFSIAGSIVFIKVISEEAINIIDVLGMVTYSSTSFLGCTILAWGNCVGDFVVSVAMAQQGYQRMGLASCIAGPLFLLTLGLGCTYLYKCVNSEDHTFEATQGSMGETCTVFLMCNLVGMIIASSATNFNFRRSIGIFLIIIYALFCLYCLLGEYQFIHPFGTDHTEDYGIAYL